MLKFDCDTAKALRNLEKHGISFEEASPVFYGEFAVQFYDDGHSNLEPRKIS